MALLHMETDLVLAVGQQLGDHSAQLAHTTSRLGTLVEGLSSHWSGGSRDQFLAEIVPAIEQMREIASRGDELANRLRREVDEWLEVDNGFGDSVALPGVGILPFPGETPFTAPQFTVPEYLPEGNIDKEQWDFRFNADDLIGYQPPGADTQVLNEAMKDLANYLNEHPDAMQPGASMSDVEPFLRDIADARGLSYEEVAQDYIKYVDLLDGEPPVLTSHEDYWGSTQQLRFGKIVGDSLDVDPVFGALLRPQGGLIGPGDGWLFHDLFQNQEFMRYHGAAHDASGFLQKFGVGPGYEYAPGIGPAVLDKSLDVVMISDPRLGPGYMTIQEIARLRPEFDGQETGMAYWIYKLNQKRL